jgi:lipopolysaccharide transport system permease protein
VVACQGEVMLGNTVYSIFSNCELIREMAIRDFKEMTKGAFLGLIWVILSPLIQVAVYVAVVSFVFKSRLGGSSGYFDYAIYVLSGMVPWQLMNKSLTEAPSLIRNRIEVVKQIIYPIETLPISSLIVSSIGCLIAFCIFLLTSIISWKVTWSLIILPVPFFLLSVFLVGMGWIFSIAGILIKDLREIVAVFLGLMVYVSPVVVSERMIGGKMWKMILFNPLAHVVICFRDVYNATFHPFSWSIFVAMSMTAFVLGGLVITKTKILINEYI